ncbi:site-2 protease family protein [Mycobacterium sp. ML4]
MRDTIPLGRIAGFKVNVHWSVIVILWLFTWSLATTLPSDISGYPRFAYWVAGACGALVLSGSLLAHELAHAVVARRVGVRTESVTLWLFGGVTTLKGEASSPRAAFRIALAGPATSLALSVAFAALAVALEWAHIAVIAVSVVWWLAAINMLLGLFNLLPGAPLDGGRLVRALLWQRHGDRVRAAVGAAHAGRIVAIVLIGLGLAEFVLGGLISGVWLAFIGWFILAAAREEEVQATTQQMFGGLTVADAMTPEPHTAPDWISVEDLIQRYVLGDRHSAYPVADHHGSTVGLVTLRQLRDVAPDRRATTLVREVALPLQAVPTAAAGEPLNTLLQRMTPVGPRSRALVMETDKVVGIVTSSDIARLIDVYRLAGPGTHSPSTRVQEV